MRRKTRKKGYNTFRGDVGEGCVEALRESFLDVQSLVLNTHFSPPIGTLIKKVIWSLEAQHEGF